MTTKNKSQVGPTAFWKAINAPTVRPFISMAKVVKSRQFQDLMEELDEHFAQHRDTGGYERLLAGLDGTRYIDVVADYLRLRHGLRVSRVDAKLKVSIPKTSTPAPVSATQAGLTFDRHLATRLPDPAKSIPAKSASAARPQTAKDDLDALDHPARLPGSYGHGKRR